MFSSPVWIGVSADHELLLQMHLTHAPLRLPTSFREPLRLPINPQAEILRLSQKFVDVFGEADRISQCALKSYGAWMGLAARL